MAFTISRIDRIYREYDVAVAESDGTPVMPPGVTVALLSPGEHVKGETVWDTIEQVPNVYLLRRADRTVISTHSTFADALTAWQSAPTGSDVASRWKVLVVGPDADATGGAHAVPTRGANVFLRVDDTPEIDAEKAERIYVQ